MPVPCNCCPLGGCFTINGDPAQPAFGFRCGTATNWYDAAGNAVAAASVLPCDTSLVPFVMPDLHLLGGAFNDDPGGHGENLCNVVPAPSANTGWTAPSGGCYDPTGPNPTMDWAPLTGVDITYGGPNTSGGVFIHFSSPTYGAITWAAAPAMTIGSTRWSSPFGGGRRARMTYVSGGTGNDAPVMPGGTQINLGFGGGGVHVMNVRFRLEFFQQI